MPKNYYNTIYNELQIWVSSKSKVQIVEKMISLAKIDDVNAIKILRILIEMHGCMLSEEMHFNLDLDYQSKKDGSTIYTNLANNKVKAAYRLLHWLLLSIKMNPEITDAYGNTIHGYLIYHLVQMYQSDNNFHSRQDLEKVMIKILKIVLTKYPIDLETEIFTTENMEIKKLKKLIKTYQKKNPSYYKYQKKGGEYLALKEIVNKSIQKDYFESEAKDLTQWKNNDHFQRKRYTYATYEFMKRNL